jgi:hypothetical protein
MSTDVPAPAVELTVRIRYPLPELDPEWAEFGITTLTQVVEEELASFAADPRELADVIESARSSVAYSYEIDAPGYEFVGGELDAAGGRYPLGSGDE